MKAFICFLMFSGCVFALPLNNRAGNELYESYNNIQRAMLEHLQLITASDTPEHVNEHMNDYVSDHMNDLHWNLDTPTDTFQQDDGDSEWFLAIEDGVDGPEHLVDNYDVFGDENFYTSGDSNDKVLRVMGSLLLIKG